MDGAFIGMLSSVHQFSVIGSRVMVAHNCAVNRDSLPFTLYSTRLNEGGGIDGLNYVGLKRSGRDKKEINEIETLYINMELSKPLINQISDASWYSRFEFILLIILVHNHISIILY